MFNFGNANSGMQQPATGQFGGNSFGMGGSFGTQNVQPAQSTFFGSGQNRFSSFGNTQQQPMGFGTGFEMQNQSSTMFGNTQQQPMGFGASTPSNTQGFGVNQPAQGFGSNSTMGFGSTGFGQSPFNKPAGIVNTLAPNQGTGAPPYQPTPDPGASDGCLVVAITAMPQYNQYSFEELRIQDYTMNKKHPGCGIGAGSTPSFGGSMFNNQPSMFGATKPSGFGQNPAPVSFGNTMNTVNSGFPSTQSSFGTQNTQNSFNSNFGVNYKPANFTQNTFGTEQKSFFGMQQNQPATVQKPQQTGFQSFTQPQTTFPTTTTTTTSFNQFGTTQPATTQPAFGTSTAQPSFSAFSSQNTQQPASTSIFTSNLFSNQQSNTQPSTNAPASTSAFSSTAQTRPATTTPFTFTNPAPAQPSTTLFDASKFSTTKPTFSFTNPTTQPAFGATNPTQPSFGGFFQAPQPTVQVAQVDSKPWGSVPLFEDIPGVVVDKVNARSLIAPAKSLAPPKMDPQVILAMSQVSPMSLTRTKLRMAGFMPTTRRAASFDSKAATKPFVQIKRLTVPQITSLPAIEEPQAKTPPKTGTQLSIQAPYTVTPSNINNLSRVVGLKIEHPKHGSVEFLEPVDLSEIPLERLCPEFVSIEPGNATFYSGEADKVLKYPGLKAKVRITLNNMWPIDKCTFEPIKSQGKGMQEYIQRLKDAKGTKFVNYDEKQGKWEFIIE